ncbi:MAG: dephospho-CoA kinase [Saprospiraceae bacterium]
MLKVGITGGIGSGKTTVCKIFETLGIPVYYADDRAKMLMVEDPVIVKKLKELFGEDAYFPDQTLNRAHLSTLVFQDKTLLQQLNAIIHPAVHQDGLQWQAAQKEVPYTLKEAAILFESGSYKTMDKVITVFANKKLRIARVKKRDQLTTAQVEARISKQMPEREKKKLADFIINNSGHRQLIPQIWKIHRQLVQLTK